MPENPDATSGPAATTPDAVTSELTTGPATEESLNPEAPSDPAATPAGSPDAPIPDAPTAEGPSPASDASANTTAVEPAAPEPAPEPEPEIDEIRAQMLGLLQPELGDAIVGVHSVRDDLWVRVRAEAWRQAAEACKSVLDCDYFGWLGGMDWMVNPDLPARSHWDPEKPAVGTDESPADGFHTGYAGGDTRFQVIARLYSTKRHWGITLKADLDPTNPSVESLTGVYRGADWHERETWEMYGFDFPGHPGLRKLYLPGGFEGYPMRKDFPLLAREVKPWPGLVDKESLPGDDGGDDEEEEAAS